jgi:hypothetical protein
LALGIILINNQGNCVFLEIPDGILRNGLERVAAIIKERNLFGYNDSASPSMAGDIKLERAADTHPNHPSTILGEELQEIENIVIP